MADLEVSLSQALWSGVLSAGLAVVGYILQKKDQQIDKHADDLLTQERKHSALELKMAEEYATKDSLKILFQESQRANKDSNDRLEKRVDETRTEVSKTNDKIDRIGQQILTELSKKT